MTFVYFKTSEDFRQWLRKNHDSNNVLQVGFFRKDSGKPSISYPEAVDEALCFGWIDGVRHKINDSSYTVRFTPRKKRSIWSAVNIKRVAELTTLGRMHASGLKTFRERDPSRAKLYSTENRDTKLDPKSLRLLKSNAKAWEFFQSQAPSYRRIAQFWVVSAKKEETRRKRLYTLIRDSVAGRKIKLLTRKSEREKRKR